MLTINIGIPLFVCLLGALIYFWCTRPNPTPRHTAVAKLAEHMFWCGLLVTLFIFATTHVATHF